MPKDYYLVLGVEKGANLSKIKKAYRTVIKRYHPDITRTNESTARFLEIRLSMEDIGLRGVYLNILVLIDRDLEEEW